MAGVTNTTRDRFRRTARVRLAEYFRADTSDGRTQRVILVNHQGDIAVLDAAERKVESTHTKGELALTGINRKGCSTCKRSSHTAKWQAYLRVNP